MARTPWPVRWLIAAGSVGALTAALWLHARPAPAPARPAAAAGAPVVVLAAGDSITAASYPRYLQELFDHAKLPVRVVNAGVKGHTSGEYLGYLRSSRLLPRTDPDIVLLQLGTNDVRIDGDHTDTPRFSRQMTEILDAMLGHENSRGRRPVVFLSTIPPVVVAIPRFFDASSRRRVVEEINPAIRRLAVERGLPVVDTYELFVRHPEWLPEIHPNENGYRAMARQWFERLDPQVRRLAE
jgi:lysophospholipase L1-like esterase